MAMDTGAGKEGDGPSAASSPSLPQLERERRSLYAAGAACIFFGCVLLFASWDYAGAACAIAAGAICVDAGRSAALFAARLRAQRGACEALDGRACCCRRACCPGCYTGPTCGAPLHLYGLLVSTLVLGSVFLFANVVTLWVSSARYRRVCDGWVDEASFRAACSAYVGGGGPNGDWWNVTQPTSPAEVAAQDTCFRLRLCAQVRYEYVTSALSLVLHAALLVAGSFALAAYNRLRVKVAGTPLMALVGATTGTCGGPNDCGACCVPVPMPLAYLSSEDIEGGGGGRPPPPVAAAAAAGSGRGGGSAEEASSSGGEEATTVQ
jgi:hypothetical protein